MEKILVVGGTGFIGYHLVKMLTLNGWDVTSFSLNLPTKDRFIKGVRYLRVDVTDVDEVKRYAIKDFDYIVNLGGYINHKPFSDGGIKIFDQHFVVVKNLVDLASRQKLKRFVQIGSSDEYGDAKSPQKEDMREAPFSPYSLAKAHATSFLQMLYKTEKFPVIILRLFLTYGPGQGSERFFPQIIVGCLKGKNFPTSQARQLRDFCYVEDTVSAIHLALLSDHSNGEVINIASGKAKTIREVIELVVKHVGRGSPQFGMVPYREGENMGLFADIQKAKKLLRWKPIVSLDDGIKRTIDWFKKYAE
ncbi:MAG: hypothetical protein CBC25_04325 [Pelagibacteraceae bacterium TMED65]|nr:MAG: hypothetical protein CBC25_04325 [Pelagibacteraceae bacterium TMED65]|tara:strand:- start:2818 stop:3732 length:915 start_codon:yes stop_codon:yes gene_type:complete